MALPKLIDLAGIPVDLDVEVDRLPAPVEAAVYFLCAEGLTNAAKYAEAHELTVSVSRTLTEVVAEIVDDGVGDADPERGSGLRGLADRVETLGGTLSVESAAGRGTRLRATIPLGADNPSFGSGGPATNGRGVGREALVVGEGEDRRRHPLQRGGIGAGDGGALEERHRRDPG